MYIKNFTIPSPPPPHPHRLSNIYTWAGYRPRWLSVKSHKRTVEQVTRNLPVPPRIYPFRDLLKCLRIPESTPPFQNIPPFSTTVWDPLRIYPSLPEYTPLFNKCICATLPESIPPSHNTPPFSITILLCDLP